MEKATRKKLPLLRSFSWVRSWTALSAARQ